LGFTADPAGAAYSAPQSLLLDLRKHTFKEREGRAGNGKRRREWEREVNIWSFIISVYTRAQKVTN